MEYININQDFKFISDDMGNIHVYQLIKGQEHYYDTIDNMEPLPEDEFRYKCKCWYSDNVLY